MGLCEDKYYAEVAICDAQFTLDWAACNGDPTCQLAAITKHAKCQQAAYLRYIDCIGQQGQGGQSADLGGGAPSADCGCAEKGASGP